MWTCKHCEQIFENLTVSEKANHARWCDANPKRNDTAGIKAGMRRRTLREHGPLKDFNVDCAKCGSSFIVNERAKKHPQKDAYYCSRSCANSQGGLARAQRRDELGLTSYRTLCERALLGYGVIG